ncbi:hypothetical protein OEZ85_002606 [Tetradesmus obliquus]|uniref:G-patch domain-containing protein n=1 Tax=Tetradesmus obliquus TaxID=3088 RepID=A0ABY8TYH0_TETOB|nr:hypothetical protein OEZ85_002606 [Tetradesmus obliquus]
MAESDEDDYVFYGTSLQDEGETTAPAAGSKKDPALTRSLPVHQQEVTDEQGRRRFHGAFTGGYSAGYYNTVGSKEGWQPSSFASSRAAPGQRQQQSIEQFMDEDELEERQKKGLGLKASYDTFGSTAAELARAQAAAAAASRPSAIPGAVPLEFFEPVSSSIGVQLLQKMGWRQGRGIGGPAAAAAAGDAAGSGGSSKWGKIAGVSIENTPMYVLDPKQDLHGLGFDPFEGAEEFRSRKRQKVEAGRTQAQAGGSGAGFGGQQQRQQQQQRQRGVAFGTGALEETDTMGYLEDYVDASAELVARKGQRQEVFAYEEASESDDEDRFNPAGRAPAAARIAAAQHEPVLALISRQQQQQHGSFIPNFRAASQIAKLQKA